MGKILVLSAYCVYAAFWLRFFAHLLVWWKAAQRLRTTAVVSRLPLRTCTLTAVDVVLLGKVLDVNPALWIGEWTFHASFLFAVLRHLRYFLDPVPHWVWWLQTPGLIAGYILPFAAAYILVVRALTRLEKYAAPANMFLVTLVLLISSIGVIMHAWYKPDLVDVKLFALGTLSFQAAAVPESLLFVTHFTLALVLMPFLPTHILTAPLVMLEARRREEALHMVMHDA
jgi:nitrate reductase gamma subunit